MIAGFTIFLFMLAAGHILLFYTQAPFDKKGRRKSVLYGHLFDLVWCALLFLNWQDATLWQHFILIAAYAAFRHYIQPGIAISYQIIWAAVLAVSSVHMLSLWAAWFIMDCLKIAVLPALNSRKSQLNTYAAPIDLCKRAQAITDIPIVIAGDQPDANARMEGIGPFKRILLTEGLLKHLSSDEILAVIAHEVGHDHHKHILKYQILRAGLTLAGITVFWQFSDNVTALIICAPALSCLGLPFLNGFKRTCEYQADRFVKDQGKAAVFLNALDKLHQQSSAQEKNDPFYRIVYHGHPDPAMRKEKLARTS